MDEEYADKRRFKRCMRDLTSYERERSYAEGWYECQSKKKSRSGYCKSDGYEWSDTPLKLCARHHRDLVTEITDLQAARKAYSALGSRFPDAIQLPYPDLTGVEVKEHAARERFSRRDVSIQRAAATRDLARVVTSSVESVPNAPEENVPTRIPADEGGGQENEMEEFLNSWCYQAGRPFSMCDKSDLKKECDAILSRSKTQYLEWYERSVIELKKYGVRTLGELPEAVCRQIMELRRA